MIESDGAALDQFRGHPAGAEPLDELGAPHSDDPPTTLTSDLACAEWTDRDLAAGVIGGRGDAYAEIYRRHAASVSAAAKMILGAGSVYEDVVADVFVGFWMSPTTFDPDRGTLRSFLRLKARGRSIDIVRSETARRRREATDHAEGRRTEPSIDESLFASEAASAVRRAVALLPPAEREALSLAFFDGMSYRAVAAHLHLAEGTVKSRIRGGLRRLATMGTLVGFSELVAPATDASKVLDSSHRGFT